MEERRYFWVLERNPFDVIKLPEFTLLEGALIVGSLVALGLYVMLIVYLDALGKRRAKRAKQLAWLERWLEHVQLEPQDEEALDLLVGGTAPMARHDLLSDPMRLESRLHEALSEGLGITPQTAEKLRDTLGYTSHNLRVPVVSTRQLVTGDSVRIFCAAGGTPHHYYGKVAATGLHSFAIEVHEEATKVVAQAGGVADLFYIRGQGLEYLFAHATVLPGNQPNRLVLRHMLVEADHTPRAARLPVMLEVNFRVHSIAESTLATSGADKPSSAGRKGLLLDLSTGGFCMGHERPIEVGRYIEFKLPLKRRRQVLTLMGRVRDSRAFGGEQWLSRCELRGLDSTQRKLLAHILSSEQTKRLKILAPIRRGAAKAG